MHPSAREPETVTTTASHHLSPAFPGRAPWGTAGKLRAWQQKALERYLQDQPRDFLAVATPGAGKTTFALTLASWLLHHHVVQQVTVVAPTEHLKKQWADAAARIGIRLDPEYSAGPLSKDYHGVAVTYAGVGVRPMLHRNRCEQRKTLVILDEIHHAGDSKSWGEACLEAFEPAARRLALTGTPFRSDTNPIPFVAYEEETTASAGPPPTTPTATATRSATASCGPSSSSATAGTCAGAPRPVTRSPPSSASP